MDQTGENTREEDKETGKMAGNTDSGDMNLARTNESEKEDEGKKGSGGKASGGAGAAGGIRLPPNKLKEIMQNWEHLDATKVVARLAEFFSELPARASANVEVKWTNLKNHGYAIVTNLLNYGQEISRLMHNLSRENVERLRSEYGIMLPGPSG